ncbi:hypothetical protein D9V37_11185 [Nocardioides mangrovicus]|uniref:DUF2188 domain-containing protein n=1 Tax=Nocardioides mangrovicus TaxID=2478913 RepID=A0A3L8P2P6_9ACTN|nr:hypothetical protein [Nocardioides mangrovicus]RLV49123.1 hypothetical protein D9V37_11185 [Nocardioides mangrovicus]
MPEATAPGVWWWRLEAADGSEVAPPEGRQEFPTRGEAESYVGEFWAELASQGVAAVTLLEDDREVYGPMPLSA